MSMRPRARADERGVTLVDSIVLLATVLLLAGLAVPRIAGYLDEGRRARAQGEIRVLAGALRSFRDDLGMWPTRRADGAADSIYALLTGSAVPTANPYAAPHTWITWAMDGSTGDVLDNHLLRNQPGGVAAAAYPTTGTARWRGPYLAGPAPLDPWGRPYCINVISGYYRHATMYRRLYLLSAGPNGRFDTDYTATASTDIAGDDVGIVLAEQR